MLTSKIIRDDLLTFRAGFQPTLENAFLSFYGENILNQTPPSIILAIENILKHKIFYDEEWFFYKDINESLRTATVSEIGAMVAREYGANIIAYVNSDEFKFNSRLKPTDTEVKSYKGTDTKEFTHGKKTTDKGTSNSVGEVAPINSAIDEINTPSVKNENHHNFTLQNEGMDTDKNTMDYSITTNRENFEYMFKYLEYYAEKGNILYNMLESEINKFIADKIKMF